MHKIKVAAVSYINTYPFIYGIEKSGIITNDIELSIQNPSKCAEDLLNNRVNLGLVPVAIVNHLPYYKIVSDYCIGASNAVKSVALFSDSPIHKLKCIHLDYQSKTSVLLVKILARKYWKINPLWLATSSGFEKAKVPENEGVVIIGDRVFDQINRYKFTYDLALEWKKFTGLPFVFAAWIANKPLNAEFIRKFNQSLNFGLRHIPESIACYNQKKYSIDLEYYLKNNIDYQLDNKKKQALKKFLVFISEPGI